MAIRIDATNEVLEALSHEDLFTDWSVSVCCWCLFDSLSANQSPFTLESDDTSRFAGPGRSGSSIDGVIKSSDLTGPEVILPSDGTWMWMGMTLVDGSTMKLFLATPTDVNATITTGGFAPSGSTASTRVATIYVGWDGFLLSTQLNGKIAFVKVWADTLPDDEMKNERWTALPQRTKDLAAFYPHWHTISNEHLTDYGGNARDLTQDGAGIPTDADAPPVSLRVSPQIILPTAIGLSIPVAMHNYRRSRAS